MADAQGQLKASNLRRDTRLRETLRGRVAYQDQHFPCLLEDFSEHGMHLLSAAKVSVGERVAVDLHICEDQHLPCVLDVRHVNRDGFGGKIVAIEPSNLSLLVQMIAFAER